VISCDEFGSGSSGLSVKRVYVVAVIVWTALV